MKLKMPGWLMVGTLVLSVVAFGNSFADAENQPQTLSLEQAVNIAMKNSLQRRLAEGDLAIARDKVAQAKSGYLPKLTLNAGYTHYNEVPADVQMGQNLVELNNAVDHLADLTALASGGNPNALRLAGGLSQQPDLDQSLDYYGYTLILEQPLYTGNKLGALNKQAKANEGCARSNLDVADHNLVYEVKKSYYTVIAARQLAETMQQAVDSMAAHVKEADAYCRAGLAPKLDVMRAEVKLADLRQKLLMARNGLALAKMSLNFTLGVSLETDYTVVENIKYEPFRVDLETCQSKALVNRPEVAAIKAKVEMAKQNIELAKSAGKPIVAFRAENEHITPYNPDPSLQLGVVASMNLYDGGMIQKQVAEAKEVFVQAQTAQELINRAVKLEVEQAYRNLQAAFETIQVAEKSLDQAKETVHMAGVSYKSGLSTSLERIDAEVGLTQAKTNYTQALSLYNIALAQLEKAMGQ